MWSGRRRPWDQRVQDAFEKRDMYIMSSVLYVVSVSSWRSSVSRIFQAWLRFVSWSIHIAYNSSVLHWKKVSSRDDEQMLLHLQRLIQIRPSHNQSSMLSWCLVYRWNQLVSRSPSLWSDRWEIHAIMQLMDHLWSCHFANYLWMLRDVYCSVLLWLHWHS